MYLYPTTWKRRIKYLPLVMALGIGLSFSNAQAVLEALFGVKTSFVRTPKYGIESNADVSWFRKKYKRAKGVLPALELLFAAYFLFLIVFAAFSGIFGTIPFFLLFFFGYAYTGLQSVFGGVFRSLTAARKARGA